MNISLESEPAGVVDHRAHATLAWSAPPVHHPPSAARRTDQRRSGTGADGSGERYDALERTLGACLAVMAELASASGQLDRSRRLRGAAHMLRTEPRAIGRVAAELAGETRTLLPTQRPGAAHSRQQCPLTAREQEVAALIPQGLSNRQIAEELVISERTADTHVQNILNKLGLASRTQVAVWWSEAEGRVDRAEGVS